MKPNTWTITKRNHLGQPVVSYPGEIVVHDPACTVLRCTWERETWSRGLWRMERGDTLIEWFSTSHWFNSFEVRSPQDQLRGWYCNMSRPAIIEDGSIQWDDLALDLLVLPDRSFVLEDTREYRDLPIGHAERRRLVRDLRVLLGSLHSNRCTGFECCLRKRHVPLE